MMLEKSGILVRGAGVFVNQTALFQFGDEQLPRTDQPLENQNRVRQLPSAAQRAAALQASVYKMNRSSFIPATTQRAQRHRATAEGAIKCRMRDSVPLC